MCETQKYFQVLLEGTVPLLQAEQVDGGKVIHERKQNTSKNRKINGLNTMGTVSFCGRLFFHAAAT